MLPQRSISFDRSLLFLLLELFLRDMFRKVRDGLLSVGTFSRRMGRFERTWMVDLRLCLSWWFLVLELDVGAVGGDVVDKASTSMVHWFPFLTINEFGIVLIDLLLSELLGQIVRLSHMLVVLLLEQDSSGGGRIALLRTSRKEVSGFSWHMTIIILDLSLLNNEV